MTGANDEGRYCLSLQITRSQYTSYEVAASRSGLTILEWATSRLDEAACEDVDAANPLKLSPMAFESFCRMLDKPLPKAMQNLLRREEIWV